MNANAAFVDMHASLFDAFASPASVAPKVGGAAVPTRMVVDEGVERIGEYGQSIGRVNTVDFLVAEYRPAPGDVVTLLDEVSGAPLWTKPVASIAGDDGFVAKAVLHG